MQQIISRDVGRQRAGTETGLCGKSLQEKTLGEMNGKGLALRNITPSDVHTLSFQQRVAIV